MPTLYPLPKITRCKPHAQCVQVTVLPQSRVVLVAELGEAQQFHPSLLSRVSILHRDLMLPEPPAIRAPPPPLDTQLRRAAKNGPAALQEALRAAGETLADVVERLRAEDRKQVPLVVSPIYITLIFFCGLPLKR